MIRPPAAAFVPLALAQVPPLSHIESIHCQRKDIP